MAEGAGKYDDVATAVMGVTNAEAVVVMICGGPRGTGYAVQLRTAYPRQVGAALCMALRLAADTIERDIQTMLQRGAD